MKKIIEVEIAKLKDQFDIRNTLNEDHVLYLWGLIDAGVELPPIKITRDYAIIDGRHRRAAYQYANIPIIKAEIIDSDSTIELVKEALGANIGGALPPTKMDLCRTMMLLINKNYSRQRIMEEIKSILPAGVIRSAYHHATWKINTKKVNEALDLVRTSNITIEKASEIIGVSKEAVKHKLEKKKSDLNDNVPIKQSLSQSFMRFNKGLGRIVGKVFQGYDDGEHTFRDANDIFKYLGRLIANQGRMYSDWQKRWEYKK